MFFIRCLGFSFRHSPAGCRQDPCFSFLFFSLFRLAVLSFPFCISFSISPCGLWFPLSVPAADSGLRTPDWPLGYFLAFCVGSSGSWLLSLPGCRCLCIILLSQPGTACAGAPLFPISGHSLPCPCPALPLCRRRRCTLAAIDGLFTLCRALATPGPFVYN